MTIPSILPPASTRLERAVEQLTMRLGNVDVDLPSKLWNPQICPPEMLPWMAWGLSLDAWDSNWSEAIRRSRVASAIAIARQKGTAAAVRSVIASFGGSVAIREWWQMDPPGTPHTFHLVMNLGDPSAPVSGAFVDQVIAEVTRVKPVRSHFDFTLGINASARIGLFGAARPIIYARIDCAG